MNTINKIFLLLILTSCGNTNTNDPCFPEKGIKTAKTTIDFEDNSSTNDEPINDFKHVEFDREGKPTKIIISKVGSENRWLYEHGKLTLIISKRKVLPAFYSEDQIKNNSEVEIDTARVIDNNADGKPDKILVANGVIQSFEYFDCDGELITTINANGDTIQQVLNKNVNGILTESTFTTFNPVLSSKTKYYDYKFNEQGHWVTRKYKHPNGKVFIESRELTYY